MSPCCEVCEKLFVQPNKEDHAGGCIICGQECCAACLDKDRICRDCNDNSPQRDSPPPKLLTPNEWRAKLGLKKPWPAPDRVSESGDREHIVELGRAQRETLIEWLQNPNGSHRAGRVTFEAVEGGGILVRTDPYP